jgi:superkiller protein 3
MTSVIKRDEAVGYNTLGVALGDQAKWEDAAAAFWKAIELDPDYLQAYLNLGVALGKQGELDAAATAFRKVLSLQPDEAEALVNLAVTLEAQGQEKVARMYWQKAKGVEQRPEWVVRIKEALETTSS